MVGFWPYLLVCELILLALFEGCGGSGWQNMPLCTALELCHLFSVQNAGAAGAMGGPGEPGGLVPSGASGQDGR